MPDNALTVSGLLVLCVGGDRVKPYLPAGSWDPLNFPKRIYEANRSPDQYCRGLHYLFLTPLTGEGSRLVAN